MLRGARAPLQLIGQLFGVKKPSWSDICPIVLPGSSLLSLHYMTTSKFCEKVT